MTSNDIRFFPHLQASETPYLQIAHRLGYPNYDAMGSKEKELLEDVLKNCLEVWEPKGLIRNSKVISFDENKVRCEDILIPSKDVVKFFDKAYQISFLLVSVGKEAVALRDQFNKEGNITKALMSDAILSELTDSLADNLNKLIDREARMKSSRLTMRYSPGYGDLALNFQKNLLDFLDFDKFRVHLTENYIMIPEKSVTAMIGWVKNKN